jgi:hypothetical protein
LIHEGATVEIGSFLVDQPLEQLRGDVGPGR